MPILPPAGVFTVPTPLTAGMRWVSSNLIRFFQGTVQQLGGCVRLSSSTFTGICRGLRPFFDLASNTYIAIGTTQRLQRLNSGTLTDITPIRATVDVATPFTTTAGSATVTVTDTTSVSVNDWVWLPVAAEANGLLLQGFVQVTAVLGGTWQFTAAANATGSGAAAGAVAQYASTNGSHTITLTLAGYTFTDGQTWTIGVPVTVGGVTLAAGTYTVTVSGGIATIAAPSPAGATATVSENGGNVRLDYLLQTSTDVAATGPSTFGTGTFGTGVFGEATGTEPFGGWLRQWSLDAWGEDRIANPTDGGLYVWLPPIAPGNVAALISNAPAANIGFIVVAPIQQLMAFGCTDPTTGKQDPRLIRFCDVDDYTSWTATATNQAGSFRISGGNTLMGWSSSGLAVVIWTDLDLWIAQYLNFPLVWGFTRIGRNCGRYSMRARCTLGGVEYWMSQNGFFMFAGGEVQPLPCTVWDYLFDNLDTAYPGAVHMGADEYFSEFFLFFPTAGSNGVCNSYVKYSVTERAWDYGVMPGGRSAWTSQSIAGAPIGADYAGLLQEHDNAAGFDGATADSYAESGWIALAEGAEFISLKRLLTDFNVIGTAPVLVTLSFVDYIDGGDSPRVYGPYSVSTTTRACWVRARGRYVRIKVECQSTSTWWRLGKCEAEFQPDGRR